MEKAGELSVMAVMESCAEPVLAIWNVRETGASVTRTLPKLVPLAELVMDAPLEMGAKVFGTGPGPRTSTMAVPVAVPETSKE